MTEGSWDPNYWRTSLDGNMPPGFTHFISAPQGDDGWRFVWLYSNGSGVEVLTHGQDLLEQRFLLPWEVTERWPRPPNPLDDPEVRRRYEDFQRRHEEKRNEGYGDDWRQEERG